MADVIRISENWRRIGKQGSSTVLWMSPLRELKMQSEILHDEKIWCITQNTEPKDLFCNIRRSKAKEFVKKFIKDHPGG